VRELHRTSDASARNGGGVRIMQGEGKIEAQSEDEEHEAVN